MSVVNVQQVTGTTVGITQTTGTPVNVKAYVPASFAGYTILTGLGNPATDYATIQGALDEASAYYLETGVKKFVYIPHSQHAKYSDMLLARDHTGLIVDGILENVTTSEAYNGQGRLIQIGRIAQSDFEPTPNELGTVGSQSGNRITFSSVNEASWFALYNSAGGRVFKLSGSTEGNPAASDAYIKAAGEIGGSYYIDLEDSSGADIDADVTSGDTIHAMDTIGVSSGFLNQIGTNVFSCENAYRGKVVTLENPDDAANFTVGEKVYLKGAGYYIVRFNSDRAFTPYYAHADVIEAIDGANITLQVGLHDLGEEITDLQLCKFTNLRTILSQHPSGGISPGVVNDFYMGGKGLFKMNINAGICNASNFINCTFNFEGTVEAGGFVTNGMTASSFFCNHMITEGVGVSIAQGAADFNVRINQIDAVKASGEGSSKTARSFLFPHENCINGNIWIGSIKVAQDYPLALNILQADCRNCIVEFGYEIQKRQLSDTASFGLGIKVRSQDPQLLGTARGYHGGNTFIQNYGIAPFLSSLVQIDDQEGDYEDRGDVFLIRNHDSALGEVVDIGAKRANNDITLNVIRRLREVGITNLTSSGANTIVECTGDVRVFGDGQNVNFADIDDANWAALNTGNYSIVSMSGAQSVIIDFDSSLLPDYAPSGSPVMKGAETAEYLTEGDDSVNNVVKGYIDNQVDTTVAAALVSASGGNRRKLQDAKSRQILGQVQRLNVMNPGNADTDGNYTARPSAGYFCTHAGKVIGGDTYPMINRLGRVIYRLLNQESFLTVPANTLKVGDTFEKVIRGQIFGSYVGTKTIQDAYRWIEAQPILGVQTFSFDTTITGGTSFMLTTRFTLNAAQFLEGEAIFNDGTEQRQSVAKRISIPSTALRSHVISYFDSSFNPVSPASYASKSDFAAYEDTFATNSIVSNSFDRIVINSVEVNYYRKLVSS